MNQRLTELKEKVLGVTNVKTEKLFWQGQDTRKRVITDSNNILYGVMGRNYVPVGHGDVYAQVSEWLPESNIVGVATGGRNHSKAILSIELPKVFDVNNQEIKTYVNLVNSLDGSTPIGLIVSPLRVACTNQFILLKKKAFINLSFRHTSNGVYDFNRNVRLVEQVYNVLEGQISLAKKLVEHEYTTEKGRDFLNSLIEKKLVPEKVIKQAEEIWINPHRKEDEDRNLWTLFNSITEPLNNTLREKNKINTFNQIEKVGEVFTELATV